MASRSRMSSSTKQKGGRTCAAPRNNSSLERKLEDEQERIDTILFAKQDHRVLLSLREDYLPQLEGLKPLAPSIMENRQRLRQTRRLNDRRRQRGLAEITPALLSESAEGILEGFYEGVSRTSRPECGPLSKRISSPNLVSAKTWPWNRRGRNCRTAAGR